MTLFDPIRRCNVEAKPEEIVRQNLLHTMIDQLCYPKSLLCVEVELKQIPHLLDVEVSSIKRRADIICFGKKIHDKYPLYPLLMIECKAEKLTSKAIEQVVGYNYYVGAFFIAVAAASEIQTLYWDAGKQEYSKIDFLPSFDQLMEKVQKRKG